MTQSDPGRQRRPPATVLLLVVFLALFARLAGFVVRFGNESLQADLAAYYTAGQSVRAGLSPYDNHVRHDPPIWDGVNVFEHSRFLYPPLVASGFGVLCLLPYHAAKFVWMVLSLAALAVALALATRLAGLDAGLPGWLAVAIATCWFYPVLTLLERGQIDAFTLLLLVGAFALMKARRPRSSLAAGAFLALAVLLKLNCLLLLPFLLIRRRWRVVAGLALAIVLLLGVELAVNGSGRLRGYAFEEMPRIAEHGEGGTREMSLPGPAFGPVLRGVERGKTTLNGRQYSPTYFRFVLNGSLVQAWPGERIRAAARAVGLPQPRLSQLATLFLAAFFVLLLLWQRRCRLGPGQDLAAGELVYWQSVLVVILLCGPVTWAMNAVWLLPVVPVVLREWSRVDGRWQVTSLALCVTGLLLVGMPDPHGNFMLSPFGRGILDGKYVLGQLLCLAGLLGLWSAGTTASPRSHGSEDVPAGLRVRK